MRSKCPEINTFLPYILVYQYCALPPTPWGLIMKPQFPKSDHSANLADRSSKDGDRETLYKCIYYTLYMYSVFLLVVAPGIKPMTSIPGSAVKDVNHRATLSRIMLLSVEIILYIHVYKNFIVGSIV